VQEAAFRLEGSSEEDDLLFNCYLLGHMKWECTNETVCQKCREVGHEAKDCKRPRSPASEAELRALALAKHARRSSPGAGPSRPLRGGPQSTPLPPSLCGGPPSPPLLPPPLHQLPLPSRLPAMDAWPQLSVLPALVGLQTPSVGNEIEAPLCVVRRSANMNALE
jgi:hypothetical protein